MKQKKELEYVVEIRVSRAGSVVLEPIISVVQQRYEEEKAMAKRNDQEITFVISRLTHDEAKHIKQGLITAKQKIAPNADAAIFAGRKTMFEGVMKKCRNMLGGD